MAKRQSQPLRNIDDNLKLFDLITFRSFGFVMMTFSGLMGLNWSTGLLTLMFGKFQIIANLAGSGFVLMVLAWAEKHDDEHLVPSALRFYTSGSTSVIYSGARGEGGATAEEILRAHRR
jgi:hypothetical protein